MAPELDALLAPISEQAPCGPDLSYEPARVELEKAFHTDVSIDTSGREAAAVEIDWNAIVGAIVGELGRSKDIWLASYLCRAGAMAGRLDMVALGAELLAGLVDSYWDSVHPRLEEVGMAGRRTACDPLAHKTAFLDPLARVPLLRHERHGAFSGEVLIALRHDGAAAPAYGPFQSALQELGDGPLKAADETLGRIDAALRRADALFMNKAGPANAVDFGATYGLLAEIRQAVVSFYLVPAVPAGAQGRVLQADGEAPHGPLNSRDDVVRALDAVVDYYLRKEPSSPLLPFLERAKAWVPMSFLDLLADIAPDSLNEAKRVLTTRPPG